MFLRLILFSLLVISTMGHVYPCQGEKSAWFRFELITEGGFHNRAFVEHQQADSTQFGLFTSRLVEAQPTDTSGYRYRSFFLRFSKAILEEKGTRSGTIVRVVNAYVPFDPAIRDTLQTLLVPELNSYPLKTVAGEVKAECLPGEGKITLLEYTQADRGVPHTPFVFQVACLPRGVPADPFPNDGGPYYAEKKRH